MGAIRSYWENIIYGKKAGGDSAPVSITDNGELNTNLNTLLAGEDQTNNVLRVEKQNGYVLITASTSADVDIKNITAGAGDLLVALYFNSTASEDIVIRDGTTDVFTIASPLAGETWYAPGDGVMSSVKWAIRDTEAFAGSIVCIGRYG